MSDLRKPYSVTDPKYILQIQQDDVLNLQVYKSEMLDEREEFLGKYNLPN